MTLNSGVDGHHWSTETYYMRSGADDFGYEIVNVKTGCTEMIGEQEPQCVMAMMWLQQTYDEVMADPEREFKIRQQNNVVRTQGSSSIVN